MLGSIIPEEYGTVLSIAVAFVLGMLLYRFLYSSQRKRSKRKRKELEEQISELGREIKDLRERNRILDQNYLTISGIARDLNAKLRRQEIAPLVLRMVERLIKPPPGQILLFYNNEQSEELELVAKKGSKKVKPGFKISLGEGIIGWAAQRKRIMEKKDYKSMGEATKIRQRKYTEYNIKPEICVPITYGKELLGVISAGEFSENNPRNKDSLILASYLSAIALTNAELFEEQQKLANLDGLTRIYNKRFFLESFREEIEKAKENSYKLSIFMFDIDNFKNYNDKCGHLIGDEALKIFGKILKEQERNNFLPARYGGEEFILLMPEIEKEKALKISEKLREEIESTEFPEEQKQPLGKVTISGGVATFPDDSETEEGLISIADKNLYKAKGEGKNKVF